MRHVLALPAGVLVIAGATLLLGACNSSDNNSSTGGDTGTQSATGIWTGTDSVSGLAVTGLIDSGGRAYFIREDGVQFVGAVQVSSTTLAVSVDGYPDFDGEFSDGSTYGIGTLSGTVATGDTLTATLAFTTNGKTSITGSWSLTYAGLSDTASSTGAMAGTYADSASGATFIIGTDGAMSITNSPYGCSLTGSVTTSDTTHDLYEVSYSYSGCTGTYEPLNGVQFTGLGFLNASESPAQVIIDATGTLNGDYYGIVSTLAASS
jgi:hypothetical protein